MSPHLVPCSRISLHPQRFGLNSRGFHHLVPRSREIASRPTAHVTRRAPCDSVTDGGRAQRSRSGTERHGAVTREHGLSQDGQGALRSGHGAVTTRPGTGFMLVCGLGLSLHGGYVVVALMLAVCRCDLAVLKSRSGCRGSSAVDIGVGCIERRAC